MNFSPEGVLLIGSVLTFCSILISKTGYRFGIPTLLLFLLVGMFFGSDGLGLQFNKVSEAQFIGMIALSIILFTGGMDTKLKDIKPVMAQGVLLSTAGVLMTTLLTGIFIFWISQWSITSISLPLMTSILLAATMSSTDSASVFNLLRSQKMHLKENLRPMLELESGSNDPMAYMLTIALIQVIASGLTGRKDRQRVRYRASGGNRFTTDGPNPDSRNAGKRQPTDGHEHSERYLGHDHQAWRQVHCTQRTIGITCRRQTALHFRRFERIKPIPVR